MKKEVWIDGKLIETIDTDFSIPVSVNNHFKYRRWASNYVRKHSK